MKAVMAVFLAAALASHSWAADDPKIEAADAAKHIGETVVVHGTVAEVKDFKGGSVALDIGAPYPNQVFEVYIPVNVAATMGKLTNYRGKEIDVDGRVELYKGKPEIKLQDAGQLRD